MPPPESGPPPARSRNRSASFVCKAGVILAGERLLLALLLHPFRRSYSSGREHTYLRRKMFFVFFQLWVLCSLPQRTHNVWRLDRLFFFVFLPVIASVACPTGPHPPLRLARRPNRGHIGGGGWTPSCGTFLWCFFSRVGWFSTFTLVNREVNHIKWTDATLRPICTALPLYSRGYRFRKFSGTWLRCAK